MFDTTGKRNLKKSFLISNAYKVNEGEKLDKHSKKINCGREA